MLWNDVSSELDAVCSSGGVKIRDGSTEAFEQKLVAGAVVGRDEGVSIWPPFSDPSNDGGRRSVCSGRRSSICFDLYISASNVTSGTESRGLLCLKLSVIKVCFFSVDGRLFRDSVVWDRGYQQFKPLTVSH